MNSILYIGNLSYSTTEADLWTLFSQAGSVVSVDLITDRASGRSKGFAFIVMGNLAEAEKAIEMFNGLHVEDREIRVSLAHRREVFSNSNGGQSLPPLKRGRNKR